MTFEIFKCYVVNSLRELEDGDASNDGSAEIWSSSTAHSEVRTPSLQAEAPASRPNAASAVPQKVSA